MATILNARDVLLQATTPRLVSVTLPDNIVVPAVKSIELTAPSLTFQVSTTGTASPTSIVLTATLKQITGTVTFSVTAGTATLTGTGSARTLTYANLATSSATIRASVTEGAVTYTKDLTISKVLDGSNGTNGTNGTTTYTWIAYANNSTGTSGFTTGANAGQTYIGIAANKTSATESSTPGDYTWSLIKGTNGTNGSDGTDGAAFVTAASSATSAASVTTTALDNAVSSAMGRARRAGDAVTLHNQTSKWSQAWVFTTAWAMATMFIDGNAVITGTLSAGTLSANKVIITPIASRIHGSGITIAGGELLIEITTTSAVATPLWSWASDPPSGVTINVYWNFSTTTSVTFLVRAFTTSTGAAYSGNSGSLKIWMF